MPCWCNTGFSCYVHNIDGTEKKEYNLQLMFMLLHCLRGEEAR